jgi:hypothetical protein
MQESLPPWRNACAFMLALLLFSTSEGSRATCRANGGKDSRVKTKREGKKGKDVLGCGRTARPA